MSIELATETVEKALGALWSRADALNELKKKIVESIEQLQKTRSEQNMFYNTDLVNKNAVIDNLEESVRDLNMALENKDLRIAALLHRNEQMGIQLKTAETKINEQQNELDRCNAAVSHAQKQLDCNTADRAEIDALKKAVDDLTGDLSNSQINSQNWYKQRTDAIADVTAYKEQIEQLKATIKSMDSIMRSDARDLETNGETIAAMKDLLQTTNKNNEELNEKAESTTNELSVAIFKNLELANELEKARQINARVIKLTRKYQTQLTECRADLIKSQDTEQKCHEDCNTRVGIIASTHSAEYSTETPRQLKRPRVETPQNSENDTSATTSVVVDEEMGEVQDED